MAMGGSVIDDEVLGPNPLIATHKALPRYVTKHIAPLDGIRGLAVLLVFFHHSISAASLAVTMPVEKLLVSFIGAGWIGVDIFFALSGFLITGILLDSKGNTDYFLNFYARRTLRIFPLYYLFLALVFVVFAPLVEHLYAPNPSFLLLEQSQWWFWSYLQNWHFVKLGTGSTVPVTHLWSLAVEEQFYLVWPFVVFLCSTRRVIWISAAICVASPLLRLMLLRAGWTDTSVYMATVTRMDALVVGALLAAWLRSQPMPSPKQALIALMGILVGGGAITTLIDHGLRRNGAALQTIGLSVISVSATLLILLAVSKDAKSGLHRILTIKFFRQSGKYSYAIYIFHPPILWGLAAVLRSHKRLLVPGTHLLSIGYIGFVACALLCTYAVSLLSWELYEQHFLSLKRYFVASLN
jgi:peptidoglycan/LPS O-acetylase OafA/YrhL